MKSISRRRQKFAVKCTLLPPTIAARKIPPCPTGFVLVGLPPGHRGLGRGSPFSK
jgi:hypothetical protein